MTDYVLECCQNAKLEEYNQVNETFVNKVIDYANFLKQPLKLEMYVPCDEDGNVLNYKEIKQSVIDGTENWNIWENAKEKVIFDGFEWKSADFGDEPMLELTNKGVYFLYDVEDKNFQNDVDEFVETIEDLVRYNLDLAVSF
jgi:hypothetical protein